MTASANFYREEILALHRRPRNWGRLETHDLSYEDSNGLCGDALRVEIRLDAGKRVEAVRFSGDGCALTRASASMASDYVARMSVDDLLKIESQDILQLLGVEVTDERMPCALLPLWALHGAALGGADAVKAAVRPAQPVVVLCATERWIPPTRVVAPRLALVAAQVAGPDCRRGC
jgi:nitrogen fixation NifU-like protein